MWTVLLIIGGIAALKFIFDVAVSTAYQRNKRTLLATIGGDTRLSPEMEKLAVDLFVENSKYCNEIFRRMDTGTPVTSEQHRELQERNEENELIKRLADDHIADEIGRIEWENSRKS